MHRVKGPAKRTLITLALGAASWVACTAAPPGARLEVAVAPLSLPGLSKVCYDLKVTNAADGAGSTVWRRGSPGLAPGGDSDSICSTTYGNGPGGAITFVGACDASVETQNSVTLWVDGLYDSAGAFIAPTGPDGWQDPCSTGCTLNATCLENQDTRVEFNLTILRQANQGFFDIGVNFEDIFCSAKVDCVDAEGQPLALLFRDGQRDTTVVAAMACTAGPGAASTELFRNDLDIFCDGGVSAKLDPGAGRGNAWGATATADDPVWQYAIYAGDEVLNCGAQSCQKQYWNIAIGLDATADNCHLRTTMTAAKLAQLDFVTPAVTTWPYIDVDVQLTDASGLTCTSHPLNGGNGVATRYTPVSSPVEFAYSYAEDAFSGAAPVCTPACQNGGTCGPDQVCICPSNTVGATCEILVPQDDADGAAFIAAAPISDTTQQSAIMRLVYDLKQAGVWSKMKAVYPFVGGTASRHKFNLKDPRDLDAAFRLQFSGTWTHSATGARPQSNAYANTFLVQTANFASIASQHYSFYSRTEVPVGDGWNIGVGNANTGNPLYGLALKRNASDPNWSNALIYDNGNYTQSGRLLSSETDARGFYLATGTSLTSRKFFKNRSLINASTTAPTGAMVPHSYYIGCINNLGTAAYCLDNEVAFASIGDGLSDAESMAFHDAVQRFNTTLNRHVGVPLGPNPRPAPGLIAELDARNPLSYASSAGGSTWVDLLGLASGTIGGALWSSVAGGTFNFDGNDHVDLGRSLNAYIGDNLPITFEVMVYLNPSTNDEYILGNNWDSSGFHIRKTGSTNAPADRLRYLFLQRNGAVLNYLGLDSGVLAAGWYHIVALYNGQGMTTASNLGLYLNGVSVGVAYNGGGRTYVNSARTINLGRTSDGNQKYLNGRIPWLRVYDKALSPTDIAARFSAIRSTYGL
jgi:hypothetical protein